MKKILLLSLSLLVWVACKKKTVFGPLSPNNVLSSEGWLDSIPYSPVAYNAPTIPGLPAMEVPADNPMTEAGIKLGRLLFYDPMLSSDGSMSCASCHKIDKAFTDGETTAIGVRGIASNRNSMSLINVGYMWQQNRQNNFNWDGKFYNLEDQVLAPVEHPLEMDASWDDIEVLLRDHDYYPRLFREAFGIEHISEIDRFYAAKALAQFLRTLNSAGSRYDEHEFTPFVYMSEQELRGFQIFIGDAQVGGSGGTDGECAHCHTFTRDQALFTSGNFANNGLDTAATLNDFPDPGLGEHTGIPSDNGKFRSVSLRNIALTAPYMHDGRIATLEEAVEHYTLVGEGLYAPNIANEITGSTDLPNLTQQDKEDIVAFLHALTDTSYVNKPEWQDPFLSPNPWE